MRKDGEKVKVALAPNVELIEKRGGLSKHKLAISSLIGSILSPMVFDVLFESLLKSVSPTRTTIYSVPVLPQ